MMRHRAPTTTRTVTEIDRSLTRCAERLALTRDLATYRNVWADIDALLDQRLAHAD